MPALASLFLTIRLWLAGRLRFPRDRIGQKLVLDGETWIIFRQVIVLPQPGQSLEPGIIFRPRFHLAHMSPRANIIFSRLPIPFFIGLPGFRSKLWLVQPQTGDFSGLYEWASREDAERYSRSFAMRFMIHRAIPGSVSFTILPASVGGFSGPPHGARG